MHASEAVARGITISQTMGPPSKNLNRQIQGVSYVREYAKKRKLNLSSFFGFGIVCMQSNWVKKAISGSRFVTF